MLKDIYKDKFLQNIICEIEERLQELQHVTNPCEYINCQAKIEMLSIIKDRYVAYLEVTAKEK